MNPLWIQNTAIEEAMRREMDESTEGIYRQILQDKERELGKEHPDTLVGIYRVAEFLHYRGKYIEAEAMFRQTLQLQEKVLGKEHPSTLSSMMSLALSLHRQDKNAEAEAILRERLPKSMLEDSLANIISFAESFFQQGKYVEAEAIYQLTLPLQEEVLGKEHLNTITSKANLTALLYRQGKHT